MSIVNRAATPLAKFFIYCNLALSIVFVSWALGIFTQRIDFGKTPASAERAAGELAKRDDELKVLTPSLERAQTQWMGAEQRLRQAEVAIQAEREWYAKELQSMDNGVQPLATIAPDRRGLESITRPRMVPFLDKSGQPVPSMQTLVKRHAVLHDDIEAEMQALERLVKEEKALTQELLGDGVKRGLRPQLALEKEARQNAQSEQEYLEPLLYNRRVEAALLQKRQKSLDARLQELQSVGQATVKP